MQYTGGKNMAFSQNIDFFFLIFYIPMSLEKKSVLVLKYFLKEV